MWRNRRYILFLGDSSIASIGYSLYTIAIPLFSYIYSHSILFTGLILFTEYGIYSLTSLVGPVIDNIRDKRFIFILSYPLMALSSILLGLLVLYNMLLPVEFVVLVAAISIGWDFAWTADHVAIPLLVEDDQLMRANGYADAIIGTHSVGGFAVGGVILLILGPAYIFFIYGVLLLISAVLYAFIPLPGAEAQTSSRSYIDGWRYLFREKRSLLYLSIFLASIAFFSFAPQLYITYLSAGSFAYTLNFVMFLSGTSIAGLVLGRLNPGGSTWAMMFVSAIGTGLLLLAGVLLYSHADFDFLIWLTLGAMYSVRVVAFRVYLQRSVDKNMLGRAVSSLYTFRGVTSSAGILMLPFFVLKLGVNLSSSVFAVLICAITIAFFLESRTKRPDGVQVLRTAE